MSRPRGEAPVSRDPLDHVVDDSELRSAGYSGPFRSSDRRSVGIEGSGPITDTLESDALSLLTDALDPHLGDTRRMPVGYMTETTLLTII